MKGRMRVTGRMEVTGAEWGDTRGGGDGREGDEAGGSGVSPAGRSSRRSRDAPRPEVLIGHRPLIMLIQHPWAEPSG